MKLCSCGLKQCGSFIVFVVKVLVDQIAHVRKDLLEANAMLQDLQAKDPNWMVQYFQGQWERQRATQLKVIGERAKEKRERLNMLLKLEENLIEAR